MLLLLGALAVAQAGVTRHAIIVGSNDGGADLPRLRYAESDAERLRDVLVELGGFAPESIALLREPSRDELLTALRDHAWLSEQEGEDMFVFYYSGHANSRGLRLGEEVLPYAELRQSINELDAEVRLGVLDACRSGEITRLKGLSLSEPFASDDVLQSEGEAWLTASSSNEDAQESDLIQGGVFTHYLISGMRGAADRDDGVVSLAEAFKYTSDQTIQRTSRSDAGAQHPSFKFDLQGKGDLPLTDTRDATSRLTIPATLTGSFLIISADTNLPVVEVSRSSRDESPSVIALAPGSYILRRSTSHGTEEAGFGLQEGSNLIVPELYFKPLDGELASRKGEGEGEAEVAQPLYSPQLTFDENMEQIGERAQARIELLVEGFTTLTRMPPSGAIMNHPTPPPEPMVAAFDPSQVPAVEGGCRVAGPDCLAEPDEGLAGTGFARLLFESGAAAAEGELRDGVPQGRWVFYEQGGAIYVTGSYTDGIEVGEWTWWHASGQPRLQGVMYNGLRSGRWVEYYDDGVKKSQTTYENGSPSGRQREWYPSGDKKSDGEMLGENRYKKWLFYHPDGRRQAVGSYDTSGLRTGKWRTWSDNGELASKGTYWHDLKHGEWLFKWENGEKSAKGTYNRGQKIGHWDTWHPNGARKSSENYTDNVRDGRWTEWYDNGALKARGRYKDGEPVGRWVTVTPEGVRTRQDHGGVGLLNR